MSLERKAPPTGLDNIPNDYAVELTPPDIARYADGSDGIPYVHTFRAAAPGPHVAVTAVVHGNEPCGAIALTRLFDAGVRPVRGALSLAFMNVAAYEAFDPTDPNASRWVDEDFNRLWSDVILEGQRDSVELARARQVRPFVDTIDLLLDIHSMQHPTTPLMMAGPAEKGIDLARATGMPEIIVRDEGHAAGPRLRDYAGFVDPTSAKNAVLVECGQHWERGAAEVAYEAAVRFLRACGAVLPDFATDAVTSRPRQRVVEVTERVTVDSEAFAFAEAYRGMDVIPRAGTVIATDGDRAVRTPYDDCVLVMPSKRLWPGQTAVRLGRFTSD